MLSPACPSQKCHRAYSLPLSCSTLAFLHALSSRCLKRCEIHLGDGIVLPLELDSHPHPTSAMRPGDFPSLAGPYHFSDLEIWSLRSMEKMRRNVKTVTYWFIKLITQEILTSQLGQEQRVTMLWHSSTQFSLEGHWGGTFQHLCQEMGPAAGEATCSHPGKNQSRNVGSEQGGKWWEPSMVKSVGPTGLFFLLSFSIGNVFKPRELASLAAYFSSFWVGTWGKKN